MMYFELQKVIVLVENAARSSNLFNNMFAALKRTA